MNKKTSSLYLWGEFRADPANPRLDQILDLRHSGDENNEIPLIFDSPHSGSDYPNDMNAVHPLLYLRQCEDLYVNAFFQDVAPQNGATYLGALFPRSYIDVNRAPDDIDPLLCSDDMTATNPVWQGDIWRDLWPYAPDPSKRSDLGIGVIRRLLTSQSPLYDRPLSIHELAHRLSTYYAPYHRVLQEQHDRLYQKFGQVWHVNCHSMPSYKKRRGVNLSHFFPDDYKRPDFILGTRDGTSCDNSLTDFMAMSLGDMGYSVGINDFYKGVYILQHYGRPDHNRHVIQLEINKALYVDETTTKVKKSFKKLMGDLSILIDELSDFVSAKL